MGGADLRRASAAAGCVREALLREFYSLGDDKATYCKRLVAAGAEFQTG